jgi:hypothetical protein
MVAANQSIVHLRKLLRHTTRAQARLLAQIEVLDSFIFQARAQIAPIRSLPTEVLSDIFSFYALSHPQDLNTLTTVCRFWRNVALNDPRLWSVISIQIRPRCIPVYLSRSRSLPLQIRIQPISSLELWSTHRLTYFLQITLSPPERKRIHSFDVVIPSRLMSERFVDAFYQFTEHEPISLEHLTWINIELSCHAPIADDITLGGSATLVAAGFPAPQCSKLQSLAIRSPMEAIDNNTIHQLYRLASHSALHTLELTEIRVSHRYTPQPVSRPMPSLRTVRFRIIEPLALGYILECLSMQSVETLMLDFSGIGQPESHFASTLSFNFPNLKNLSLIGLFTMDHSGWKNILSQNVGIEELTCESSSFGDAELGFLSSPSASPTESHPWPLPTLKCLQIQGLDISWESVSRLQMARGVSGKEGVTPLSIIWMK